MAFSGCSASAFSQAQDAIFLVLRLLWQSKIIDVIVLIVLHLCSFSLDIYLILLDGLLLRHLAVLCGSTELFLTRISQVPIFVTTLHLASHFRHPPF